MNDPSYPKEKPMTLSRNVWIAIGVLIVVAAIGALVMLYDNPHQWNHV